LYRTHPPNPLASACARNAVAELHSTARPSLQVKPILQVSDIAPGQLRCSPAASPPSRARRSMHALGQGLGARLLRDACALRVFPYVCPMCVPCCGSPWPAAVSQRPHRRAVNSLPSHATACGCECPVACAQSGRQERPAVCVAAVPSHHQRRHAVARTSAAYHPPLVLAAAYGRSPACSWVLLGVSAPHL
jgi:hypothetical protein